MTDKAKKLIGGVIALGGALLAFSTNKEEKKSETTVEVKTETETKSEEVNEPEEKTEE